MIISNDIKNIIQSFPEGRVFSISDFAIDPQYDMALAKLLSRMSAKGEIQKIAKGKYYKPQRTPLGTLSPVTAELVKDFLEKDGKVTGYTTGTQAFSAMGIGSQISGSILIGTNKYRRALDRGGYTVRFLKQENEITEENIELLRILDAIRLIREIPSVSPNEACASIIEIIRVLDPQKQQELGTLALAYTNYVRAIVGAIFEMLGLQATDLRNSLNGVSSYKLPISSNVLPTKDNWRIYEPAR